ncbi:hypothetical protein MTR67_052426 [Solanum verrucosum]|uniref:Chromo domain-containing protein n=1 Tax=Solanum verrucosum TaxID=315347 RepID=A0AAF1A114_SOLVR|nr:hypothetical protein MTR67_052426 [Solanum verrucosum]
MGDPSFIIPTEDIEIKDSLSYEEILVQILDRQVRKLRTKEVASVKVLWRNQFVKEATWEAEEGMKKRYPHLFESEETADQGSKLNLVSFTLLEKSWGFREEEKREGEARKSSRSSSLACGFRQGPGQGFAWGQQWFSSASHAQGVGSGRDNNADLLLDGLKLVKLG